MALLLFMAALLCVPVVGVILLGLLLPLIVIPIIVGLVVGAAHLVVPRGGEKN
jgi:hypothetical protein